MTTKDLAAKAGITESAMRRRKCKGKDVHAPGMHSRTVRGRMGAKASPWSKGPVLFTGIYFNGKGKNGNLSNDT